MIYEMSILSTKTEVSSLHYQKVDVISLSIFLITEFVNLVGVKLKINHYFKLKTKIQVIEYGIHRHQKTSHSLIT